MFSELTGVTDLDRRQLGWVVLIVGCQPMGLRHGLTLVLSQGVGSLARTIGPTVGGSTTSGPRGRIGRGPRSLRLSGSWR